MTAYEARELTAGSMKRKGPWFKAKLTWLCGRINKEIENAAEKGKFWLAVGLSPSDTERYYILLKALYENSGYTVTEADKGNKNSTFFISWDERLQTFYSCPECGRRVQMQFYHAWNGVRYPSYKLRCECGRKDKSDKIDLLLGRWTTIKKRKERKK